MLKKDTFTVYWYVNMASGYKQIKKNTLIKLQLTWFFSNLTRCFSCQKLADFKVFFKNPSWEVLYLSDMSLNIFSVRGLGIFWANFHFYCYYVIVIVVVVWRVFSLGHVKCSLCLINLYSTSSKVGDFYFLVNSERFLFFRKRTLFP